MKSNISRFTGCTRMIVGLAIVLLVAIGCSPSPSEKAPTTEAQFVLTVSGSGTTTAILGGVKSAFETDTPGYRLSMMPGAGTGGGVKGVTEGLFDVAAMARPPKDTEAAQGVEYVEFGQSGVAIYAHPSVGVSNLTAQQVTAIFSGTITNWSEVGGPSADIILYVRDEADSSTKALRSAVLGDTPFLKTARTLTSQSEMQEAVATTPHSVGVGSWPSALAAGVDVRAVALDGVAPGDPAYPMVAPIGIGYLSDHKAEVQPLIDWLLSAQGKTALQKFGVIVKK